MSKQTSNNPSGISTPPRTFTQADIPAFMEKIFSEFDDDKNNRFTKKQFPAVIRSIISFVGGETPTQDDVEDLFNLLDINGDEHIDRNQFTSLLKTFFSVLKENKIEVQVGEESDIIL